MTVLQAIELFKLEMTNEIFNCVYDDALQDSLTHALDNVSQTVIDTYKAERKNKLSMNNEDA